MQLFKDPDSVCGFRVELPRDDECPVSHFGEYLLSKDCLIAQHSHETWEFVLQMENSSRWHDSTSQVEIKNGDLLICPPGLRHSKNRREQADFRICFAGCLMDPDLWPLLRSRLSMKRMTRIPGARATARHLHSLHEELLYDQPMRTQGVTLAWKHLWLTVHRLLSAPQHGKNWLAQRVRTLVEAAPGERWTLKDAARFMGYAPNYFAELFKRESGLSFHRFLMDVRVRAAEEALGRGAQNITEIALTLGFSSSQHFSRVFAEKTGVAPSQWPKRLATAGGSSRKSGKSN